MSDEINTRLREVEQELVRVKTELALIKLFVIGVIGLILTSVGAAMISRVLQ